MEGEGKWGGGILTGEPQSREGLKGCSGVLLESQPILISQTGLRVAHQRSLVGNVFLKAERSSAAGKQFVSTTVSEVVDGLK